MAGTRIDDFVHEKVSNFINRAVTDGFVKEEHVEAIRKLDSGGRLFFVSLLVRAVLDNANKYGALNRQTFVTNAEMDFQASRKGKEKEPEEGSSEPKQPMEDMLVSLTARLQEIGKESREKLFDFTYNYLRMFAHVMYNVELPL